MPKALSACLVLIAVVFAALPARALDFDEARHFLSRTGFGGNASDIAALAPFSRTEAVDRLLASVTAETQVRAPGWVDGPVPDFKTMRSGADEERFALFRQFRQRAASLKGWWFAQMVGSESPFTERLVLFWHNHFTTELRQIYWAQIAYRQNLMYRAHALGNYRDFVKAVSRDPAMVVYLDSLRNVKAAPNENFARELLELFTLGEGHYTEADIRAAARAFTGYSLDRGTGAFRFRPFLHDTGDKTFLGRSGRFDGDDIIDIVFEQPATAELIVAKLWREFVSLTPDEAEVTRLAALFRAADYELAPLLRALLLSEAFWDPANRGALIKSPVELIVGAMRMLEIASYDGDKLWRASRVIGQDIMDPPTVKGWPGGTDWITTDALVQRRFVIERLILGIRLAAETRMTMTPVEGRSLDDLPMALPIAARIAPGDELAAVLLPRPPALARTDGLTPEEAAAQLMLDPVFQLK